MSLDRSKPASLREAAQVLNRIAALVDAGCDNHLALNCLEVALGYFQAGDDRNALLYIKQADEALESARGTTASINQRNAEVGK